MKITDKETLRQLKIANSSQLNEMIETYPEDQRYNRSDMEAVFDEANWLLYTYNTEEYTNNYELYRARCVLRETKNGKKIRFDNRTLKPKYTEWDVMVRKNTVNEYRRLDKLVNRLVKMLNE